MESKLLIRGIWCLMAVALGQTVVQANANQEHNIKRNQLCLPGLGRIRTNRLTPLWSSTYSRIASFGLSELWMALRLTGVLRSVAF